MMTAASSSLYYEDGQQAIETTLMPKGSLAALSFAMVVVVANPRTEGRF